MPMACFRSSTFDIVLVKRARVFRRSVGAAMVIGVEIRKRAIDRVQWD